ncbi:MAG: glycine--tRNA ligase subunit beta [Proteobacteria bacterium]|jgi:glycyl-tRNA synthetase beta chain|nr:glycine--tRNA ligase subunit beta [Pseudomonadota bacterium]MBU4412228.1 glycine--tRNA ligase subunit beta [Pseudomonadota bacterium]MCG2824578.1 glycine--tRNA ligase subunit beta [Desulfobulbaceae bacterium]
MQHELLFEIGTEEVPAGYIMPALAQLEKILGERLTALALPYSTLRTAATPRRLAVSIGGLAERQPDRQEEILGPPKKAAFDQNGQPTQAAIGFAKKNGVGVEALQILATPKGEYLMVRVEQVGRPTSELLAELLPEVITSLNFPKSMRWGAGRTSFARPIQWLLAVYGGKTVPFTLDTITSSNTTCGHRFMARGPFPVSGYSDYVETLRAAQVMVEPQERRDAVLAEITRAAQQAGGTILPDDELVDTVCNLVEKPFAICGAFEERFLALPREVLITSMREHQKYFAVVDAAGKLMPNFIAVNNTDTRDAKLAADGHQRVIRARLEDAFFFFKEDQRRALKDRVEDLTGVIFQHKLGTMLDKTRRVTTLAGLLAKKLAPEHLAQTERAALLAKTDLLTDMVGEFPTLQGAIGHDYALLGGETPEVARAIREHYLPVRAGGVLPTSIPGALVGMADRLDSITGCFGIGQIPTGTADPFGLRRLSLGLLHIINAMGFRLSLAEFVDEALSLHGDRLTVSRTDARRNVLEFIKGRFSNDLTGQGIPAEAVEAVTSVSFDDPVDCKRKIKALMAISGQEAFPVLAGAFKRVINIIKDNSETAVQAELLSENAEQKLHEAYLAVSREATPLLEAGDYEKGLGVILKMKEPVDTFFEEVMVMAEDEKVRANRLNLLTAIARLFLRIGDFSKMNAISQ